MPPKVMSQMVPLSSRTPLAGLHADVLNASSRHHPPAAAPPPPPLRLGLKSLHGPGTFSAEVAAGKKRLRVN